MGGRGAYEDMLRSAENHSCRVQNMAKKGSKEEATSWEKSAQVLIPFLTGNKYM